MTFSSFVFNEGEPAAGTTDGRFTVTAPTAAPVSVGGRVLTTEGRGIKNALVTLVDADGGTRTATTGATGYYRFDELVRRTELYCAGARQTIWIR